MELKSKRDKNSWELKYNNPKLNDYSVVNLVFMHFSYKLVHNLILVELLRAVAQETPDIVYIAIEAPSIQNVTSFKIWHLTSYIKTGHSHLHIGFLKVE